MKRIDVNQLKSLFPLRVYKQGMKLFREGLVEEITYDKNHHLWMGNVYEEDVYASEVNLNSKPGLLRESYCDCIAFQVHQTCPHLVALALTVLGRSSKNLAADHRPLRADLIDALASLHDQIMPSFQQRELLQVEYVLKQSEENVLMLELRVGISRCFIVQDLSTFLKAVFSQTIYPITKTFTYDPQTHKFPQKDLEIFQVLLSILRHGEVYSERMDIHREQKQENRTIILPPFAFKNLLFQLVERNFIVSFERNEKKQVQISDHSLPFQFFLDLNERKQLILFVHGLKQLILLEPYQTLFQGGTFFFLSPLQVQIIEEIYRLYSLDGQYIVPFEQGDQLISEIIPLLETVGEFKISQAVLSRLVQEKFRAKLSLSLQNERMIGELVYEYGTYQMHPFQEQAEKDVILRRDPYKEREVMTLIEQAQFKYNGVELYLDLKEEELYNFFVQTLPMLEAKIDVALDKSLEGIFLQEENAPETFIEWNPDTSLLEVSFHMEGITRKEIDQFLQAVIERKSYYRMNNGSFLSLTNDAFQSLQDTFATLHLKNQMFDRGKVTLPVYQGLQMDQILQGRKFYHNSFQALLKDLKSPEQRHDPVPVSLQQTLRSYQVKGFKWLKFLSQYKLGGILADDMGLGKTIQTIAYLLSEKTDKPHLVVAPTSVIYNWENEFHTFARELNVQILLGSPEERAEKIKISVEKDVWITSYATLRQDIELYASQSFHTLILDEAQFIKNDATKTYRSIRQINAEIKFALSGTPIENWIEELWSIFQVLLPGLLPNKQRFKQLSHKQITQLTSPFILRRLKEDVLTELPPKIESISVSELTDEQKKLYLGYLETFRKETTDVLKESTFQANRMKILAGITRLRQICCHPALFLENYSGTSAKLEQLLDLLEDAMSKHKRVLVFSQFTSMHDIICQHLDERRIKYFYIHGNVPAKERLQMTERFNAGERDVFLLSIHAGGTGLNITGADTVILYDLWWNPAVEDQAIGRAHRLGQQKVVNVIRLLAEGTIEEKIYALQQKKRHLMDRIIQPKDPGFSGLTEEDFRYLFDV